MRILWITNILLPPASKAFKMPEQVVGGWMYSSLKRVKESYNGNIAVATIYSGKRLLEKEVDSIRYFLLPLKGKNATAYNKHLEEQWRIVADIVRPDVVHIHGTEYPHGLAYVKACGPQGVVVSLQGIISCIARYYTAGIDYKYIKSYLTFRDFIKRGNIYKEQASFAKRGEFETELIRSVNHIIGRTEWDKIHSLEINPDAKYHYSGETLRDSFYSHKWEYNKCQPHSIFVSQASYPLKGLHMLLKAMPLILRNYPDTKIHVAGEDPTKAPWWRINGYGIYLKRLIKELNLRDKVIFEGMVDENKMCQCYLKSNVFVCCSSIENSPNSLGEAQLLGVPYVASFVGGVPEIVNWNDKILYRFEEYEMLANKICQVFDSKDSFNKDFDINRYNKNRNLNDLLKIYLEVSKLAFNDK